MPKFNEAKLFRQLTFEGSWPTGVVFANDDRLVAGNEAGAIYTWDLSREPTELTDEQKKQSEIKDRQPNIHPVRRLHGHTNGVTRLVIADGGKQLISASLDHSVRVWDLSAASVGEAEAILDHDQRRRRIKRDKSNEAEVRAEPGIKVETQTASDTLPGHADWVYGCALSADGRRLVTGDYAGTVIVWDFPSRKEVSRWSGHKMDGVVATAVNADGSKVFVAEHRMSRGDFDRPPAQAKIFALESGEMLLDLIAVKFPDVKERDNSYGYAEKWKKWVGHGFVAASFSPDGKILAVGQGGEIGDAQVHLIEVETGKEIRSVSRHEYGICDLCFTQDGKHLLTTGRDTTVKIIRVEDGSEVATLGKPRGGQFKDWIYSAALSPSETRLAATDIGGLIHVWDLPT